MRDIEIRRRDACVPRFKQELHPVLQRVYAARGIESDAELELSLEHLLPIGSLERVEDAARLLAAHRQGRVLVIGDFDADGATSTALMLRALRAMRFAHVDFLVPNRFRFGYGLTPGIVALATERKPSLIVTVDNGVSSIAGVQAALDLHIPVLVTDHHLPGSVLPSAAVIVNPNLRGSVFASPALAGVGVAFYVMAALARHLNVPASAPAGAMQFRPADLLDLVALGTVADVVPLDRNNRILVAQGLRRIRAGRCVAGIQALLAVAGRPLERLTAADLGFAVAPRLNAAGRLDDMSLGIACLLSDDAAQARRTAAQLNALNDARRDIERRMQEEAVDIAAALRAAPGAEELLGLCLYDDAWHQGVIGLVAGRIKDRWHRPVIAFARAEDGTLKGSARSVPGVHIRDALDSIATRHAGLIDRFGGHAMAAGMSLPAAHLDAFRRAFAAEMATRSDVESLRGIIVSDGELTPAELSIETARALRGAGPWGQGFPEPIFDGDFSVVESRLVGERHLKLQLHGAGCASTSLDAIAFGFLGGASETLPVARGARVRLAYRLEINEYRGVERLQLNCQHLASVQT